MAKSSSPPAGFTLTPSSLELPRYESPRLFFYVFISMNVAVAYGSIPEESHGEDRKLLGGGDDGEKVNASLGQSRQLNRVLTLLLGQVCFMSVIALAALLFMNSSSSHTTKSIFSASETSSLAETAIDSHSNAESFSYSFFSTEQVPTYVFASSSGKYVIVGLVSGHVCRSQDYGSSFERSRPFSPSDGIYADLAGLVMTKSGKHMLASTGTYGNYISSDYGRSWQPQGSQTCSLLSASSDLSKVVCIGGALGHKNHLFISLDSGDTWASTGDQQLWTGVSASDDFSHLLAITYTGCGYVYHSSDDGATWRRTDDDETCKLKWGCLAASADAQTVLITDVQTKNVHASSDFGETWYQVFKASASKLQESVTINTCTVSADGTAFAIGFTGSQLRTTYNCDFANSNKDKHWNGNCDWQTQDAASTSGFFNSTGVAFSSDGGLFFSADASTLEVATGEL